MKYQRIVIEGTDLIGKSTLTKNLKFLNLPVRDRDENIYKNITLDIKENEINQIKNHIKENKNILFVFLYINPKNKRVINFLDNIPKENEYDENYLAYNESYMKTIEKIKNLSNVLVIERTFKITPYEIVREIIKKFIVGVDYNELPITIEGESKIYRRIKNYNIAFATLKPSVYSFTHKRYAMVGGTDIARNGIWEIIGTILNISYNKFIFKNENYPVRILNYYGSELSKFKDDIFVSNYIVKIDKRTSLVVFLDEIPNIEVVWKRAHYGTMKHRLYRVENFKTRNGKIIEKEGYYPDPIVRFNWRNPILRDKNGNMKDLGDECIADDFADFYIDTKHSKILTHYVGWWLFHFFENYDLELIDLCYFQNENGDRIHSEITPNGMRLKLKDGSDYNKDLWRKGASKDVLAKRWLELLEKLRDNPLL